MSVESSIARSDSTSSLIENTDSLDYGTEASEPEPEAPIPLRQLLSGPLVIIYLNQAFLAFFDMCYQVLLPLMYSTSIQFGGLGLTTFEIGMIMGTWGTCNGIFQLIALPPLSKKFGWRNLYIVSFAMLAVCIGTYPVLNVLARRAGMVDWRVISCMVLQLASYSIAEIGWCKSYPYSLPIVLYSFFVPACTAIFTIEATPRSSLSSANALLQMTNTFTRALAPCIASSLFSLSLERNLMGGNLVYLILLLIHVIGLRTSFKLPKA